MNMEECEQVDLNMQNIKVTIKVLSSLARKMDFFYVAMHVGQKLIWYLISYSNLSVNTYKSIDINKKKKLKKKSD